MRIEDLTDDQVNCLVAKVLKWNTKLIEDDICGNELYYVDVDGIPKSVVSAFRPTSNGTQALSMIGLYKIDIEWRDERNKCYAKIRNDSFYAEVGSFNPNRAICLAVISFLFGSYIEDEEATKLCPEELEEIQ